MNKAYSPIQGLYYARLVRLVGLRAIWESSAAHQRYFPADGPHVRMLNHAIFATLRAGEELGIAEDMRGVVEKQGVRK